MTKEILKQRIAVLERENKILKLKNERHQKPLSIANAISYIQTIIHEVVEEYGLNDVEITVKAKEGKRVKLTEIDFQKIAEDENVIIYFVRQDVQSKVLRPINMYVPEADRERLSEEIIATAYDIADVIKGL